MPPALLPWPLSSQPLGNMLSEMEAGCQKATGDSEHGISHQLIDLDPRQRRGLTWREVQLERIRGQAAGRRSGGRDASGDYLNLQRSRPSGSHVSLVARAGVPSCRLLSKRAFPVLLGWPWDRS